jgi:SNF2 family DNA or RNA helicase
MIITGIIIFAIIVVLIIVFAIYQNSPICKNKHKIKDAISTLQNEIQLNERILKNYETTFGNAVRDFFNAQHVQKLKSIPIEALKEAGASNVRLSLLREAGYQTLADLSGVSGNRLKQIRGIGQTSVIKIIDAANNLFNRVQAMPQTLPSPDLIEPYSRELAESTIKLIEAREVLSEDNDNMKALLAPLNSQVKQYNAENKFVTWLFSFGDSKRRLYSNSDNKTLEILNKSLKLKESEPFQNTRARRPHLDGYGKVFSKDDTLHRFHDRYPDYLAFIENAVGKQVTPRGQRPLESGKVPKEIANKVERFVLNAKHVKVTLRPYQEFGAKYILAQERTILGDEMGLGKTIEALAAISHLWEQNKRRWFLVISPAGITVNWEKEIQNRVNIPYYRFHGPDRDSIIRSWIHGGGIAIVSYNVLDNLNISNMFLNTNKGIDLLVADEAHYIKNPAAKRTAAVTSLLPLAKYVCFMSGTPMENHPREFVRLIDMVRPGEGDRYLKNEIFYDSQVKDADQFHRMASSVYLRRNQKDVLRELPEKIEIPEWVDLSISDHNAYLKAVTERNFMAMRRSVTIGSGHTSAKMERLDELIQEHRDSGRKVLIFSFFLDVLEMVCKRMSPIGKITGALSSSERMGIVDKFQFSKGFQVLVSQIEAGGQGINLQSASVVIIMEPQFKPTTEAQAIARAHRMGQINRVIVHRLLARNSVDERMQAILSKKEDYFERYARESYVKDASRQATETQIIKDIIDAETQRLGIK